MSTVLCGILLLLLYYFLVVGPFSLIENGKLNVKLDLDSLVPRPVRRFRLHKSGGPGCFLMCMTSSGRKVVERIKLNVGDLGLRTTRRAKVPGNLPLVSG